MSSDQEQVRREKTSIYNRLHSIEEDALFVKSVSQTYGSLPVVANQRCGSWYVDPSIEENNEFAYFKSTDGHHGRWDFNLRRANLHLLSLIDRCGGMIIVDSTRRGKRYPDALSKTVPIWCAVVNTALDIVRGSSISPWDTSLYTSPKAVSSSEHSQMEAKISLWAKNLASSSFPLHEMRKPLRPLWVSPGSTVLPQLHPDKLDFYPVICLSASKLIEGEELGGIERRDGYTYVQGSGDDHELWSKGLDPALFWKNRVDLLACSATEIEDYVAELVCERTESTPSRASDSAFSSVPIAKVGGRVALSSFTMDFQSACELSQTSPTIFIDEAHDGHHDLPAATSQSRILHLRLEVSKKKGAATFLRPDTLDQCVRFALQHLTPSESDLPLRTISVAGSGAAIKDAVVGVVLVLLQRLFHDDGHPKLIMPKDRDFDEGVTKGSLRTRLQWIQASSPTTNPSRSTLKIVNAYFMSPQ